MHILVVDDEPANQRLLKAFFNQSGYDVTTADNGADALKKMAGQSVDIIISDILMPEMDGYAFCREVRSMEEYKAVPFLFYSGTYTTENDVRFGLSLGADRFLFKPMLPSALLKEVLDVLKIPPEQKDSAGGKQEGDAFYREYSERLSSKLVDKMRELEDKNKRLQELSQKIIFGFEEERKRIAMNIHDEVLQLMLSVKIELDLLAGDESLSMNRIQQALPELSNRCRELITEMRLLSHSLYPPMLDRTGLFHHARRLAELLKKETAIETIMQFEGEDAGIPQHVALVAYRVLQEGLINVKKHAGASRCTLTAEAHPGALRVELSDDGQGFDEKDARVRVRGIGLFSMEERVKLAGGKFSVTSGEGKGTRLTISISF